MLVFWGFPGPVKAGTEGPRFQSFPKFSKRPHPKTRALQRCQAAWARQKARVLQGSAFRVPDASRTAAFSEWPFSFQSPLFGHMPSRYPPKIVPFAWQFKVRDNPQWTESDQGVDKAWAIEPVNTTCMKASVFDLLLRGCHGVEKTQHMKASQWTRELELGEQKPIL